jgi:hypothetical protein
MSPDSAHIHLREVEEVKAMAPQPETNAMPRDLEAADVHDVMREQLEYLIGHAEGDIDYGCAEYQRYLRVRSILLEIFGEPLSYQLRGITRLAKAA